MEKTLTKVGSSWIAKKAKEEINNISDDLSLLSNAVEGKAKWIFNRLKDMELDIIEMAVYGHVVRPGNQCRCRTVGL